MRLFGCSLVAPGCLGFCSGAMLSGAQLIVLIAILSISTTGTCKATFSLFLTGSGTTASFHLNPHPYTPHQDIAAHTTHYDTISLMPSPPLHRQLFVSSFFPCPYQFRNSVAWKNFWSIHSILLNIK
jgi:hypothetical protein